MFKISKRMTTPPFISVFIYLLSQIFVAKISIIFEPCKFFEKNFQ